ncbi:site-2 protease family protein [Paenibacillus fonticola]|uniref:site-2 protease family protein n=1 Tax=Paenibacillus fonticola TaxID=379896 RepID=UPI00035E3650|nr:site-2 protease family protein [Paenibacillus fonticola]
MNVERIGYPQLIPYTVHTMDVWETSPQYLIRFDNGLQMKVSEKIKTLFSYINGTNSVENLCDIMSKIYNEVFIFDELRSLIECNLLKQGVIVGNEKKAAHHSAISFRTPIMDSSRLKKLCSILKSLFSIPLFIIFCILLILQFTLFIRYSYGYSLFHALSSYRLMIVSTLLLYLSAFIHELGHMTAAYRCNIKPKDVGIGLYFLTPVLFVDLSEAWSLPRKQRVLVDISGVYFQLWVFIIFQIIFIFNQSEYLLIANHFILLTVVSNLNPSLRFDGFWVLTDILGIPNLHTRAFRLLKYSFCGYVLQLRSYRHKLASEIKNMNRKYKVVFLTYCSVYIIAFSIATTYMLQYILFIFTSILSFDVNSIKGFLALGVIILIKPITYIVQKIKNRKRKQVAQNE